MTAAGSPFHHGEHLAQSKAGVRDQIERKGRVVIRPFLPDQHQAFFANLPFLVLSAADRNGQPWASILFGTPGFVSSPMPDLLNVQAWPVPEDPLVHGLHRGAVIGCLGIELPTRRRNRVNGRIEAREAGFGFTLRVQQSFGNCPRYIQARLPQPRHGEHQPQLSRTDNHLIEADIQLVAAADTFFIASRAATLDGTPSNGLDVSHRGGLAGFVQVNSARELCFPDYKGNLLFNTVGNLLADGRCGLLFVDFRSGSMLHIIGKARVAWDVPASRLAAGIERQIFFTIERVISRDHACPLTFDLIGYSPHLKGAEVNATPPQDEDAEAISRAGHH